jgi:2-phospho-L-lactate guanylyltransferase (CobY/MobA/RfbA family)
MTEKDHYTIFSKEILIAGSHNKINFTTADLQSLISEAVYHALKRIEDEKIVIKPSKKNKTNDL